MEKVQIDPAVHALISKAIHDATQEVFATMLGLELDPGDSSIVEKPPSAASGLVALIGLAGEWSGTGSLACSGAFACQLASSFLSTPYDTVNEEVLDAVAEITNMIIGNVKTFLEEELGPLGLSTPTVIFGRNLQTRGARVHDWTVLPFRCGEETMFVQVCVAPSSSTRADLPAGFQIPHVLQLEGM